MAATGSALTHLEGSLSGRRYDADRLQRLDPADGRPLLPRYDLAAAGRTLSPTSTSASTARRQGLWRWAEVLPVRDDQFITHLGEGATPLLRLPRLAAALGVPGLLWKAEGQNPTGSFKARGMAVAVSRAHELGARHLLAPSAGNAGGALAAYAAAAGLAATIFMPADAPVANQAEVVLAGARLVLVDGLIDDCGRLSAAYAGRIGGFDMSTLKEPYRVEGKKTMAYEMVAELGGVPDAVVYPTGGGTGIVGMWKAFAEMEKLGWIDGRRPRLYSVQAAGCAPIVKAFEDGAEHAERWPDARTAASGLRVPAAVGDFLILRALRASGGAALAVGEDEIAEAQRLAGSTAGLWVSPETGAAVAALRRLRAAGAVGDERSVVVFDTGVGVKYPPPAFEAPRPIAADADVEAL